jgi:hypothetical protein
MSHHKRRKIKGSEQTTYVLIGLAVIAVLVLLSLR